MVACGGDDETTTTGTTTATSEAQSTTTSAGGDTTVTGYAEGTWKFTFNTFFPATNNIAIVGEMWQEEITKRDQRRRPVRVPARGLPHHANKVYDGVVTGISDLGFSVLAYTPGIFPVMELLDMPNGYPRGTPRPWCERLLQRVQAGRVRRRARLLLLRHRSRRCSSPPTSP